jgi:hypothetical protein
MLRKDVVRIFSEEMKNRMSLVTNGTHSLVDINGLYFVSVDGSEETHNRIRGPNTYAKRKTNVLKDIRMIEPAKRGVLPLREKVYRKAERIRTIEELEEMFPGLKAIIDSTEQKEIPRPKKDKGKRKTHHSGKKRKHTLKTRLTINSSGLMIHRTNHAKGRRYDLHVYREHHPNLPKEIVREFDRGYDGVKNYFPDLKCAVPFKKRAGGRGHGGEKAPDLSPEEKAFNTHLSKERVVVVEHTISRMMKKFRVMADEFRNRLRHYGAMTNIISALVNFRIPGRLNV